MGLIRFWGAVLRRAWREAWRVVITHNAGTLVRDGLLAVVAISLLYWFQGALVSRGIMSGDNAQDTVIWILIGLVSLVAVFASVFVVEALFIAPYRLWRDAKSAERAATQNADETKKLFSASGDLLPDMKIEELFFYLDKMTLENDTYEKVGLEIRDKLSMSALKSWGRVVNRNVMILGPSSLKPIEPAYWHTATFTYYFFDSGHGLAPHTGSPRYSFDDGVEYTDVRVNSGQAQALWPNPKA